ncbi:hypothetical protein KMW28_21200 [Flammeovirga yaeyamensis]|uniref:Uncharacterized protein n=1 Tax=Flammeovirga yaeyamensis TaxID=367791 RepID=A0AAX1NFH6_9BACT|nr:MULTISPECIES: hypothetical protein [Flammeovirga]ANQ52680.1 hypothetical protein MY04_5348 [Flammeovirga sp. MY04]MBB3697130.1 hypothetical protein [Flammeovirga yaeyamensis]NMF33793.1 hypothetical protein [Flammeovirga yaeyamensis]QWG04943.1 hypothetical protein KMW28_21200 [Flammeovirga yaeyamensis]
MKTLIYFLLTFIAPLIVVAEEEEKKEDEAPTEKVEIYKGLFLNMEDDLVHQHIKSDLNGELTTEGYYSIKFLDQEALLEPVFEKNQLTQIKIIYQSDDVELIECNLNMIIKSLSTSTDWSLHQATDDQWLLEKNLDKTIDNMNQITMFTYGIHRDNVGHGWHAEVVISPRFEATDEFSEESLNKAKMEIESSL